MQPALFDSSIYITALRRGDDAALALRRSAADAPLWLSAVVLEELYAGAADRDRQVVERLERDFNRAKRILVPNLSDWTQAGRVLARLAAMHLTTQRAVYVLDVNATLDKRSEERTSELQSLRH